MIDRDDWEKRSKEMLREMRDGERPRLERQLQAAVSAERLTGQPDWDYFLSLVEARKQEAGKRFEQAQEVLQGPDCSSERMMAAKMALAEARGQLSAYEDVISLPNSIRTQGEQARKALSHD